MTASAAFDGAMLRLDVLRLVLKTPGLGTAPDVPGRVDQVLAWLLDPLHHPLPLAGVEGGVAAVLDPAPGASRPAIAVSDRSAHSTSVTVDIMHAAGLKPADHGAVREFVEAWEADGQDGAALLQRVRDLRAGGPPMTVPEMRFLTSLPRPPLPAAATGDMVAHARMIPPRPTGRSRP